MLKRLICLAMGFCCSVSGATNFEARELVRYLELEDKWGIIIASATAHSMDQFDKKLLAYQLTLQERQQIIADLKALYLDTMSWESSGKTLSTQMLSECSHTTLDGMVLLKMDRMSLPRRQALKIVQAYEACLERGKTQALRTVFEAKSLILQKGRARIFQQYFPKSAS